MKKRLLTIVFLSIFFNGFSQSRMAFDFLAKPDSIIEKRQHGYVYITSDTKSKVYDRVIPNPLDEFVKDTYEDYIKHIQKTFNRKISHFSIGKIPRRWNSVYIFKKHYVLYGPSDWMYNHGFYISDSVIYLTSSDPGDIYLITGFKSTSVGDANFTVLNYHGETKYINIHEINSNLGIYEWTISNKTKIEEKFIMQNSSYSKKIRMIICDCGDEKCFDEYEFH